MRKRSLNDTLPANRRDVLDNSSSIRTCETNGSKYPSRNATTSKSNTECDCSNAKKSEFIDKLLCYLEKQSEVIAKCCETRGKTDNYPSCDNLKSAQPSKLFQARSDELKRAASKIKESECTHDFEDCPCEDMPRSKKSSVPKKNKHSSKDNLSDHKSVNYNYHEYTDEEGPENECDGCENKVNNFFKLAEEICQTYLKHCGSQKRSKPTTQPRHPCDQPKMTKQHSTSLRDPSDQTMGLSKSECPITPTESTVTKGCKSLALEIECNGDKERFIIVPCECPSKTNLNPPCDAKNARVYKDKQCIDLFEERYGQILRDLHDTVITQNPSSKQTLKQPSKTGNEMPPSNQVEETPLTQCSSIKNHPEPVDHLPTRQSSKPNVNNIPMGSMPCQTFNEGQKQPNTGAAMQCQNYCQPWHCLCQSIKPNSEAYPTQPGHPNFTPHPAQSVPQGDAQPNIHAEPQLQSQPPPKKPKKPPKKWNRWSNRSKEPTAK